MLQNSRNDIRRSLALSHKAALRKEVDKLIKIGVLKIDDSRWSAPTCIIPKKNQTVRFISDFRELN